MCRYFSHSSRVNVRVTRVRASAIRFLIKLFSAVEVTQIVQADSSISMGNGDPAARVGPCKVPHRVRKTKGEKSLPAVRVPEPQRPISAHGSDLAAVWAESRAVDSVLMSH